MARKSMRKPPKEVELDVTSFMNLMVVLIPFLLATAVFSQVTIQELNLPAPGSGGEVADTPPVNIEVMVRKEALEIGNGKVINYRFPNKEGEYDLESLTAELRRLKERNPEKEDSTVLLEPDMDGYGLMDSIEHVDGAEWQSLCMTGGGSLNPPTHETVDKKMHYLFQDGRAVFKVAVTGMADVAVEMMNKYDLKADDVAYLVPHQANWRIIDATAKRMGLASEQVMMNINKYGNTTAATIPLCLTEYYRDGKVKKGDNLILAAFGAGFTWGSTYLIWSMD